MSVYGGPCVCRSCRAEELLAPPSSTANMRSSECGLQVRAREWLLWLVSYNVTMSPT